MHYRDTLAIALTTMDERQKKYASPEVNFARIASLASILLNRNVTPYEIAMIHLCTKLGRHIETPTYDDNIVDGVNYLAFVGTFAGQHFDGLGAMRRVEIMKGMEEALKPILTEEEMQAVMEASK
jgi:hypothetical protein